VSALIIVAVVVLLPTALILAVARPALTILPLYAATLPVASVVKLAVPLPDPFNTMSSLLGGTAILACLAHMALYRRGRVPAAPVGIWLLFLAWALITSLWALRTASAVNAAQVAVPLILLMVVVSALPVDESDLSAMRVAIIASGIAVGMYALFLLWTGGALPTHGQGTGQRLAVASNPQDTDPNILAASLLLPLVLSVERIAVGGSRWWRPVVWRILGTAGLLFSGLAILLTGSRGGALAAAISLVVALYLCGRRAEGRAGIRRFLRTVFSLAAAGALLFMAGRILFPTATQAPAIRDRLSPVVAVVNRLGDLQNRGSGRLDIWTGGYRACLAHCVWGAGFGNFEEAYSQSFAFSAASTNVGLDRPAHNIYLGLAVETGVVGLTLLVLALVGEWAHLSRERLQRVSPALRAALLGLVLAEIFLSAIWFKYFWLVFIFIRMTDGVAARPQRWSPEPVVAQSMAG
jgi:O-antigen ligase